MLREIRVYGKLAKHIGKRVLRADVQSAAEAVRFLLANWPDLEAHMIEQFYRVSIGDYDLTMAEIHDPAGAQVIKITPVVAGAGAGARILAGVALVALSVISVGGAPLLGTLGAKLALGVGASLVLGGVAQLLSPVPIVPKSESNQDPRKNYGFSGIQNTSRASTPVPIVYGEMIVGSVVISAGIDVAQVTA